MEQLNYRHLIGGLGIFLFGMLVFEETISELGRGFLKKFLEKNTNTRIKSILTGIIQTCIFQSSTVVTMMTLGFVGAGVIGLSNALGVVLGANLGTTLTPWLISFFGFKINIESIALPIIGLGGIATIVFGRNEKIVQIAKFFIGFGLLFLGLGYMKESVDLIATNVSLDAYANYNIRGYVLIGTIITTVMQTSTGATIIALTALNSGLISLDMALPLVIGINLGSSVSTSIIGLLSSTKTQTSKKKVAFSHLIFNITTTIIVTLCYPFIRDFLIWGYDIFHIDDANKNIILLSMFHTFFNLVLVLIWAPLLGYLLQMLHKVFPSKKVDLHLTIQNITTNMPIEIFAALNKDVVYFMKKIEEYNHSTLYIGGESHNPRKHHESYVTLKQMEEMLLTYIATMDRTLFEDKDNSNLRHLYESIIKAITSSKYIKDVHHHIINMKDSSFDHAIIADSLYFFQKVTKDASEHLASLDKTMDNNLIKEDIDTYIKSIHANDDNYVEQITIKRDKNTIASINIAEIIKTNRYVLLSNEALLEAYQSYLSQE